MLFCGVCAYLERAVVFDNICENGPSLLANRSLRKLDAVPFSSGCHEPAMKMKKYDVNFDVCPTWSAQRHGRSYFEAGQPAVFDHDGS